MAPQVDTGLSLLLGLILVLAGVPKLREPHAIRLTLRQLFPAIWRRPQVVALRLARALAGVEIVAGAATAALRGRAGAAAAGAVLALCLGFLLVVRRAIRVGASCSCFGRLTRTPVGGRELGRAAALIVIAALDSTLRTGTSTRIEIGWPTAGAAVAGATVIIATMAVGAWLRPAGGAPAAARRSVRDALRFDRNVTTSSPVARG